MLRINWGPSTPPKSMLASAATRSWLSLICRLINELTPTAVASLIHVQNGRVVAEMLHRTNRISLKPIIGILSAVPIKVKLAETEQSLISIISPSELDKIKAKADDASFKS